MTEVIVVPVVETVVVQGPTEVVTMPVKETVEVTRVVTETVTVERPAEVVIREGGLRGQPGADRLFVGPTPPVTTLTEYVWFQTGLGPTGEDFTLWIESTP